jgi:leucine-zipper-like transcriptional regulator 1
MYITFPHDFRAASSPNYIGNNQLIIFGGMSNQPDSANPDELCVLNDVRFFDLVTRHWLPDMQSSVPASDSLTPRARYAHLSSVTADRLFIIGGQDFNNTWLDDVCVYDLVGKAWVQRRDYPRHCGTYRSVAVSSTTAVRFPQEEIRNSQSASTLGPPGQRFGPDMDTPSSPEFTSTESLIHQPYSAPPSDDHPSDIYLYSNYNVRLYSLNYLLSLIILPSSRMLNANSRCSPLFPTPTLPSRTDHLL